MESDRLGPRTRALLADAQTPLFLSVVSAWEVVIKGQAGKLQVVGDPQSFVRTRLRMQRIASLSVSLDHVLAIGSLPNHHRDPFDRLLIAQAQSEDLTFISGDRQLRAYDVRFHDAST